MSTTPSDTRRLLVFGAHPDDIEFGVGGIIASEARAGTSVQFVVCSEGESATSGTPLRRREEAIRAASILGVGIEFINIGGDAHFERSVRGSLTVAEVIRRTTPHWVLCPTPRTNQHPDHAVLGSLVQDGARLARYGGVAELREFPPHSIEQLLYYAVGPEGEQPEAGAVWYDVSDPAIVELWKNAMAAHETQSRTRRYVELQLTRARLLGLRAGVEYAQALYPADPTLIARLGQLGRGARHF
ncbi:MAG: PIG-L family deacetylase [Opitutaceae bacterium]|nr:PIG-L family deacetylase [Opitutaceae bacterium]